MNFDWVVAIVTFLIFTVFSFNYYTAFFVYQADLDTIMIESYVTPVFYNSTGPSVGQILYADLNWPSGTKNSTRVYQNYIEQQCLIQGDRIYWQSNIVLGDNDFELSFSEIDIPMICTDSLIISGEVETTPWGMEMITSLSQSDLTSMSLVNYDDYRNFISSSRDLRVEINNGFSYGPLTPQNIDVYVFERNTTITETGEQVGLKVFVW
jgi:hypothetical protein